MRYGRLDPLHGRLVLDLAAPFDIEGKRLIPPTKDAPDWRLVVDMAPRKAVPPPARAAAQGVGQKAARKAAKPAPPVVAARRAWPPPPAKPGAPRRATAAVAETVRVPAPVQAAVADAGTEAASEPGPPPTPSHPRRPIVAIDAGHGGIDPGTVGVGGVLEKDVTLAMARQLQAALDATGRFNAVLVRDDDAFIRLRERIERGRKAGAGLFVSLHADSIAQPKHRGASVYTLSEDVSDAEAAKLASKENKADIIVGADLTDEDPLVTEILIDLVRRDTNNRSIDFADQLIKRLQGVTRLVRHSRRFAGFAVLKAPDMPSVLLELGYLSNAEDAKNLTSPAYRSKLAAVIAAAIGRYFDALEAQRQG
ncbi:MAG: N-acetylmuramoyl-L-alanine amidase [Geminicoccaceae bacterium]|nr:N-acetylmuramoyl-L-alanine amidase [Geminicoccaceae bacterium]